MKKFNELKEKTKDWYEDHKDEIKAGIIATVTTAAIATFGGLCGYRSGFDDGVDMNSKYANKQIDDLMAINPNLKTEWVAAKHMQIDKQYGVNREEGA